MNRRLAAFTLMSMAAVLSRPLAGAEAPGNLSGFLVSETGLPVPNVVVSLLKASAHDSLPTLARTDPGGRVFLSDLETGTYQLLIKSGRYRSPTGRLVEILPNRTAVVTLVLQQILGFEEGYDENLGVKALLRTGLDQRLIFRNNPALEDVLKETDSDRIFEEAVFQVYTNAGLGSNYFVFPGDSWSGTTSNFAVVDSLGVNSRYIFAGQLNSGEDSIWRFKNTLDYRLGERHSLQFHLGYSRLSFDQPSLSALDNPVSLGFENPLVSSLAPTQLMNVGVENTLEFGRSLTVNWGFDLDRLKGTSSQTFLSPNGSITLSPFEKTRLHVTSVAKKPNMGNTLGLPDGGQVSLVSPVYISRVGGQLSSGTARHNLASLSQYLGVSSEVEFAVFENSMAGSAIPVFAVYELTPQVDLFRMEDAQFRTSGYRLTLRHVFSPSLKAEVSLLRGKGPGFHSGNLMAFPSNAGLEGLVGTQEFTAVATQFDAYIPHSGTQITALVKVAPNADPLMTLDMLSDHFETGNRGVNLFVRQVVPTPTAFLGFFGLEFLAPERIEALLDIRNLLNEDLGALQNAWGDVRLVQTPRSVRGGLAFRF